MGRQPCCEKEGVKKGPWSVEEDRKLISFITSHGHGCWREVPERAGLQRCGKSCRLRWINYLRPDLKRGMLSPDEEGLIIHLHACLGNKWSKIASRLPGRTDNEIKNCWNTRIKKKLREMGIDPVTHKHISKAPSTVRDSSETGALQGTGVNVPPSVGHPPVDAAAYVYNMQINHSRVHEARVGASPTSVMTTHVTSSLSRTSPIPKCEDEHSTYSTESVNQDQSINSNVLQNNMHALATQEGLTSDSHPIFTSTPILSSSRMPDPPQPILHNLPHGSHACLEIPSQLHMLQKETNLERSYNSLSHTYQKPSPTPLHPLHISQLQALNMAQPMRYIPALQLRGSQPSSPSYEKVANTGKPLSSSMKSNNDVRWMECKEGHVKNVEGEEETGGGNSGVRNARGGGQDWSSMMSEMFSTDSLEVVSEPQVMSPLFDETSQALGQECVGLACNSFINVGPWGNMDGISSSDPLVSKYSF